MILDRQLDLIGDFRGRRVVVLGDVMLDRFVYGQVDRISPEAPVPVFSVTSEAAMPGGAANVARNIASLGGCAILLGIIGSDDAGRELSALTDDIQGVENRLHAVAGHPTTVKVRYVADRQQVVRVDRERRSVAAGHGSELLQMLVRELKNADALILSDYAKGVLSDEVVRGAVNAARGKITVVDPKSADIARYDGVTVITPNLREAGVAAGISGRGDAAVIDMAQSILAAAPNLASVIITRGSEGMTLMERSRNAVHLPVTAREVYDVSGAGDTVVATLGLALAAGANLADAAELANIAAGIVVGKAGTAEVWTEELIAALQTEQLHPIMAKNATAAQAARSAARWRAQGLRVGFTNGCFDLIHPGHISLLNQARAQCDRLIVGLNTDASVKRLKGPSRPIQDENARAVVLGAIGAVDHVVLFGEDTPLDLITLLRPDVLVKGADYTVEQVVGADVVQSYGGKVVLADLKVGHSSSNIISRLNNGGS